MTLNRAILLVHGAWHGGWTWDPLLPHLREAGFDLATVELPSSGGPGDLAADARAVREALAARPVPTLVVGHSYGGTVISEACDGVPNAAHLAYVCAFMLDVGESPGQMLGGIPAWMAIDEASGTCSPVDPVAAFYHDVPPALAQELTSKLKRQSMAPFAAPLTRAAWRSIPSTYIACSEDQVLPYPAQVTMSARAGTVHTLKSGHSPFASCPGELAKILAAIS